MSWSGKMLFKGPDLIEIFKPALHRQQNYLSHLYVCRHNLGILQAIASFLQNSEGIQRMRNIRLARKRERQRNFHVEFWLFFQRIDPIKVFRYVEWKVFEIVFLFWRRIYRGTDKVALRNASRLQSRKSFRVLDFLLLVSWFIISRGIVSLISLTSSLSSSSPPPSYSPHPPPCLPLPTRALL